jgi:hypothetical protein
MNEQQISVGMEATRNAYTDSTPCTVIAISKTGSQITLQDDDYKVISGSEQDGSAKYEYIRNPNGAISIATRRKDGTYRLKGYCPGYGFINLGFRRRYYDPHF